MSEALPELSAKEKRRSFSREASYLPLRGKWLRRFWLGSLVLLCLFLAWQQRVSLIAGHYLYAVGTYEDDISFTTWPKSSWRARIGDRVFYVQRYGPMA